MPDVGLECDASAPCRQTLAVVYTVYDMRKHCLRWYQAASLATRTDRIVHAPRSLGWAVGDLSSE
jgi:hypothetical protein